MSEAQHDEKQPEDKLEEQRPLPLVQSLTYGTGTMLAAGVVDLLAHLGPTGLVVGGIIAYAAAKHGPELVEQGRENLPAPASPQAARKTRIAPSKPRGNQSKRPSLTAPWDGLQQRKKRTPSSSRNPRESQPGRPGGE